MSYSSPSLPARKPRPGCLAKLLKVNQTIEKIVALICLAMNMPLLGVLISSSAVELKGSAQERFRRFFSINLQRCSTQTLDRMPSGGVCSQ